MNTITEDLKGKLVNFLLVVAEEQNWKLHEVKDQYGDWLGSYYTWEKESYDPQYVADELLQLLGYYDQE